MSQAEHPATVGGVGEEPRLAVRTNQRRGLRRRLPTCSGDRIVVSKFGDRIYFAVPNIPPPGVMSTGPPPGLLLLRRRRQAASLATETEAALEPGSVDGSAAGHVTSNAAKRWGFNRCKRSTLGRDSPAGRDATKAVVVKSLCKLEQGDRATTMQRKESKQQKQQQQKQQRPQKKPKRRSHSAIAGMPLGGHGSRTYYTSIRGLRRDRLKFEEAPKEAGSSEAAPVVAAAAPAAPAAAPAPAPAPAAAPVTASLGQQQPTSASNASEHRASIGKWRSFLKRRLRIGGSGTANRP